MVTEQFAGGALGRYQIEGLLGRGGMASVYRALDPRFDRVVAIKVLNAQLASDPHYRERFQREARSMARLQHPHILPVYDVGEQDGFVFLVMPYVTGGSLHDHLVAQRRVGQFRTTAILAILEPLADALDYAHRQGIIHRDIKPHNILLTERDYPFLTDFGIAKVLSDENDTPAITMANMVIGTPEYMSPEQAQGLPLDGRADLYSLGVILYELFTGRTPFRAETASDTPIGILIRHASTPPPAPSVINHQIGPALEATLLRALAKRPDDRYPTGAALFGALREALTTPERDSALPDFAIVALPEVKVPPLPDLTPPGGVSIGGTTGGVKSGTPPPPLGATVLAPLAAPVSAPLPALPAPPPVSSAPPAWSPASPAPPAPPDPPAAYQAALLPSARPPRRRLPLFLLAGSVILAVAIVGALLMRSRPSGGVAVDPTGIAIANATVGTGAGVASPPPTVTVAPPTAASGGPTAGLVVVGTPSTVVGGATRTPAGGVGTPAATRREVVFFSSHRNDVHDSQVYVMNADGSGQRQLTFTRGHSWGPRLSPDGKTFVFSSVAPGDHNDHSATGGGRIGQGHHEIFRSNVDGSNIVRLTNSTAWNNAWAWAPDGQSLILASDRDGEWELYRMSAKGEQDGITRLTTNAAQDGWPSFTPDGKRVVFASDRNGGVSQIYIMDADGKNQRQLNVSKSYDTFPSVSPDGKRIAYSVQNGTAQTGITSEIFVMNIDGSEPTRLTNTVATNTDPSWSPDGTKLIFSSDRDGNTNIYVMNANGSGLKRLTDDPGEDVTPFWGVIEVAATAPQEVARTRPGLVGNAAILPGRATRRRGARRRAERAA